MSFFPSSFSVCAESPVFVETPSEVIIAENATMNIPFGCRVRSSPTSSSISWIHKTDVRETIISDSNSVGNAYRLTSQQMLIEGSYYVSSQLVMVGVNSRDMGTIICRAVYKESLHERNTSLTVISKLV